MKNFLTATSATLAMAMFILSGCSDSSDTDQFSEVAQSDNEQADQDPHAGHAHPTHGPHGGDLIELGNEEYHAELVHPHGRDDDVHHDDDSENPHDTDGEAHHKEGKDGDAAGHDEEGDNDEGSHEHAGIVIYILDGSAANVVAIDAAEITLNLSHDGKPEQFKLAALPGKDDPKGKSSRFASSASDLLEHFHEAEHVEGTLVLSIGGKSYRGKLAHSHGDGDGHGHAAEKHGSGHDHAGGDALVWKGEPRKDGDLQILLGHHGKHLHAGETVEPAVSITRDGKPVADLKVFNSLLSADGKTVLAKEVATVFDPTTEDEPAHYAQGGLAIPAGVDAAVIRYRISTSDSVDVTFDVSIAFD
jgi:hypothetical protein